MAIIGNIDSPNQTEKPRGVQAGLDKITNTIDKIQEAMSELEVRLTPVLRRDIPPSAEKKEEGTSSLSPVTGTLQDFNERLNSILTQIRDTLDRLEV